MSNTLPKVDFPTWIYNPTPENFVSWLDDVHGINIDKNAITSQDIAQIAKARMRDGSLSTIAMMGERSIVDGSAVLIMTEATAEGTHHLTEGEWSTPLEWFMSKVEPGEDEKAWSQSMMYELEGIMNIVIPALSAAGLSQAQIMKITEQDSKARAAVSTFRPLLSRVVEGRDEEAIKKIIHAYSVITGDDSVRECKRKLAEIRGEVPPEPVIVEEAWTDSQSSVVVIRLENPLQRRAFKMLLKKLPHEERTVDILGLAKSLLERKENRRYDEN